jgi:anthranilate synthase component 1
MNAIVPTPRDARTLLWPQTGGDPQTLLADYRAGKAGVLWTRLIADLETPVSAYLKLAQDDPYAFLLESVEGGAHLGRYSVIGLQPDLIWRCRRDESGRSIAEINRTARKDVRAGFVAQSAKPLEALRALIAESKIELPLGLPPMAAGVFGYLGYDMVRQMERLPDDNPDTLGVPEAVMCRPTVIAIFDNIARDVQLVTPLRPAAGIDATRALDDAHRRLSETVAAFDRSLPPMPPPATPRPIGGEPSSNSGRDGYMSMVERAKDYIRAGDAFQIVPSHRMALPFPLSSFELYRALRRVNPSPFLFHLQQDGFAIVGSSPEILVRLRGDTVTIRPIAGTRPRGKDAAEDKALADDLLADPKEVAEHLMLLDLGRNDVGRVSEIGSVKVTERMVIELYSHVMHIVSNVEGKLRSDCDALDALIAGFPAGTVSGAPKVRAMEIIDELEVARRGVYAGCIGYFGAGGDMDTCIALRTSVVKDGTVYIQAGGGIVADSDPAAEYEETRNKARAIVRAAESAIDLAYGPSNAQS